MDTTLDAHLQSGFTVQRFRAVSPSREPIYPESD
jgi:hypothetical protein